MTGPIILITLGVLFLLNNLYPAQFEFGRMWPVILIVIGLVKIFEYFRATEPRGHSFDRHRPGGHRMGASTNAEQRTRGPGRVDDTEEKS
jgi:hypothetical protein